MQGDNTNLQPANFAPTVPTYPLLEQLCRVTSGAIVGTSPPVYAAWTQQFNPPLGTRDREACYVFEPNGVQLGPFIYDCRLVSNYGGLPLYAACCCPTNVPSSSSSSPVGM